MTAPSPDAQERLLELSQQACNGTLGAEDYIQLDALLSASHRNQLTYLEYLHLHLDLETWAVGEDRPPLKVTGRPRTSGAARTLLVGLALGLALVLALVGLSFLTPAQEQLAQERALPKNVLPPWLAQVHRFSGGAVWKVDGVDKGSHLFRNQMLVVSAGCLELNLRNGTRMSAEGPAKLVIHDDLRVTLAEGTVRATLADGVSGFQVATDTMEIVDRGTQFYVQRDGEGLTTSYVSSGVCDVRHRNDGVPLAPFRAVVAGECVLVDQDRKLVPLSPEQSRKFSERMVSSFLSYDLELRRMSPSVCLIGPPEGMLDHRFCSANRPVYLIPERRNVRLESDLVVPGRDGGEPVTLPTGTTVDSFLVHSAFGADLPAGVSGKLLRQTRTTGEIVFERDVLAVLPGGDPLAETDREFAAAGVRFPEAKARSLEEQDRFSWSPVDPCRVDFEFQSSEGDADQVRILVRSAPSGGK